MVIILFLITFFTLLGKINLSEIKPLLENGFKPVLKGSYLYISNNIFPLYLLLIIPKNNSRNLILSDEVTNAIEEYFCHLYQGML